MNYIELYKTQLSEDATINNEFFNSGFYNEYCALNCFLNSFERSNAAIEAEIIACIQMMTSNELNDVLSSVQVIKETIAYLEETKLPLFTDYELDGVVLLLGDKTVDAHGISLEGKAYLLIDLLAYAAAKDQYNPVSFIVHEVVHPIQYKLNPEMYFRNFKDIKEPVIKRIIAEGTATYLTKQLTAESDTDVFWLGYLSQEGVDNWVAFSEEIKQVVSTHINALICENEWHEDSQYLLFSVCNPEKLWEGRVAYYYGYKIIEAIHKTHSIDAILKLHEADYLPYVMTYFEGQNYFDAI